MRFLKTLTLNRRAIYDDRLAIDTSNGVVMNTDNNLLIPKGTTAERPTSPVNGMVRYNTDLNTPYGEFEVYQGSSWRVVRFKESTGVTLQDAGTGNDVWTTFGPLTPDPFDNAYQASVTWNATQIAKNLTVIVENVYQIGTVNFEVVQNPTTTGTGSEVTTGNFVATTEYIITDVGDTDFTLIGASANTVGTVFTATGIGGGTTGKARVTGTYLEFYSFVPDTKTVYVIQKLDQ
jgi:hypothetical protein